MDTRDTSLANEQADSLRQTRLRWFVALLLNLPLPFIALPITGSAWIEQQPGGAAANSMLTAIVIAAAAVLVGLFTRNQIYKANWQGQAITPAGYRKANTIFFIAVTAGALGVFVLSLTTAYPAPTFAFALIFLGLLALNFPNGKPMQPAPPRMDHDGDRP